MPDWRKFLHPLLRHPKRRGEWTEAAFVAKAMGQGLRVSKPCGESDPYDFVVFNVRQAMNRVQVKSAWAMTRGKAYSIGSTNHKFDRSEFDFLVVALPERDLWYVIPVDAVHGTVKIRLYPEPSKVKKRKNTRDFEPYREAWHLLTGDEPGAWARYQRFTIHAAAE